MLNLFPEKKVPYFILSPSWTHKSSGVRALHLLCHALNELGQKAYLVPYDAELACNPNLNTPSAIIVADNWRAFHESGIDHIVVYPDIIQGNPLLAKKVVRWLLAPAGAYGGDKEFPNTDMVYGYTKDIAEPTLCLPTFDHTIFYPELGTSPRSGEVYYANKYDKIHGNKLLPVTSGAKRLEGTQEEIAKELRAAEKCYLYERTEIFVLAQMCGCPVETIPTPYWDGEMPKEFTLADTVSLHLKFEYQLRAFIERTQAWLI